MSGTNHRTWQQYHVGHLQLTVQLDPPADEPTMARDDELARVTKQLIALMDAHKLPTTWAVSDPAFSAATPLVIRSAVQHEMAILGDSNWVGPTAGRTRFARELARRVSQARQFGLHVTSLVPRVATIEGHVDLVVKQHITAIGGVAQDGSSPRGSTAPRAMQFQVWEFPISGELPRPSHWFWSAGWSTWRQIRRAARDAGSFHLVIDAPAVAEQAANAEKTIAGLVRRVAQWRDRGLVAVETLQVAAARLADVPVRLPQRSILRRAA